jgi:hypothetical protein
LSISETIRLHFSDKLVNKYKLLVIRLEKRPESQNDAIRSDDDETNNDTGDAGIVLATNEFNYDANDRGSRFIKEFCNSLLNCPENYEINQLLNDIKLAFDDTDDLDEVDFLEIDSL